jgi:hypothetical protein
MSDDINALLARAFPDGDLEAHCRYHEEQVEREQDRKQLWRALRDKTLGAIIWALLAAIGTAIWQYVRHQVNS